MNEEAVRSLLAYSKDAEKIVKDAKERHPVMFGSFTKESTKFYPACMSSIIFGDLKIEPFLFYITEIENGMNLIGADLISSFMIDRTWADYAIEVDRFRKEIYLQNFRTTMCSRSKNSIECINSFINGNELLQDSSDPTDVHSQINDLIRMAGIAGKV